MRKASYPKPKYLMKLDPLSPMSAAVRMIFVLLQGFVRFRSPNRESCLSRIDFYRPFRGGRGGRGRAQPVREALLRRSRPPRALDAVSGSRMPARRARGTEGAFRPMRSIIPGRALGNPR